MEKHVDSDQRDFTGTRPLRVEIYKRKAHSEKEHFLFLLQSSSEIPNLSHSHMFTSAY